MEGRAGVLVIGVGNEWRGDDAAGLLAARAVAAENLPGVTVVECCGAGAELLQFWRNAAYAIVIDAVVSGAEPGVVHRLDAQADSLPSDPPTSSHAFGLAQMVKLARVLNYLPPRLTIFGIEAQAFRHGDGVSLAVAGGIQSCVEQIIAELS